MAWKVLQVTSEVPGHFVSPTKQAQDSGMPRCRHYGVGRWFLKLEGQPNINQTEDTEDSSVFVEADPAWQMHYF